MNKIKNNRKQRRLEIKRETIVYLADDVLRQAAGGNKDENPSLPISVCPTQCARNPQK